MENGADFVAAERAHRRYSLTPQCHEVWCLDPVDRSVDDKLDYLILQAPDKIPPGEVVGYSAVGPPGPRTLARELDRVHQSLLLLDAADYGRDNLASVGLADDGFEMASAQSLTVGLRLEADSVIRLLLDVGVCSSETPLAAGRFLTPLSGPVKCAYVTTHREEQ